MVGVHGNEPFEDVYNLRANPHRFAVQAPAVDDSVPDRQETPGMAHSPQPLQHGHQRDGVVGKVELLPITVLTRPLGTALHEAEPPVAGADPLRLRTQLQTLRSLLRTIQSDLEAGGPGVDGQNPRVVRG
jgi:hypothetical protein